MKVKYIIAFFLLFAGFQANGHPLHLTFTNLEFKTANSRWILTIKVFSDDFAANLKSVTGSSDISARMKSGEDKMLKTWLENRFSISFDSKTVEMDGWKFEGIRVMEDASWVTYSFTAPLPVSEIRVKDALLFDLYKDQKNLFILTMGQFQSAHEFKNKDEETVIRLNK